MLVSNEVLISIMGGNHENKNIFWIVIKRLFPQAFRMENQSRGFLRLGWTYV